MRIVVFPIFLYSAETWTVRERPSQNRCTRNVVLAATVADCCRTALRTNVSILEEPKVKESLSSTVQLRILKFFGHIASNKHSMERLDRRSSTTTTTLSRVKD
ncbi:jg25703 [Pararge aegeria aegeria]|uniref:Jg25703 protein n=1 Tax=Pararge aegeria aegeria TaxID=348720 RepID=A0A8S4S9L3_9NEOP|nr:jg25703 [Pararge aegeria aegeria]